MLWKPSHIGTSRPTLFAVRQLQTGAQSGVCHRFRHSDRHSSKVLEATKKDPRVLGSVDGWLFVPSRNDFRWIHRFPQGYRRVKALSKVRNVVPRPQENKRFAGAGAGDPNADGAQNTGGQCFAIG